MKPEFNHLPFNKLADMAEGCPQLSESASMLEHLSVCPGCSAELARLEQLINLMRTDKAETVPQEVIARAVKLFRPLASAATSEPSLARRLLAMLSFDSLHNSVAYGVRSSHASARQLLYVVGDYDIDLRVAPIGTAWLLSGQVLGPNCAGGQLEIEGQSKVERVALNDQCEFTLPALPGGTYQLRVRLLDIEIEVPELTLGE